MADSNAGAGLGGVAGHLINGGLPAINPLGSTGIHYPAGYMQGDTSSQASLGGSIGGPLRHHYLQAPGGGRMGRRVSDGGPYVAAYKLYIEKRNPQLTQIMSATNLDKAEGNNMSSSNSVRMLLQEKKAYGGLPHRDWVQFKEQVSRMKNGTVDFSGGV